MKKILVTGGTVFVSKFVAHYFVEKNYEVYVLNRNTRKQVKGVHLICADRHSLQGCLKSYHFDAVIDVCGYNLKDIQDLLNELNLVQDYIFISSSAVYPETNQQPFHESQKIGLNTIWGQYGLNKIAAEKYLLSKYPQAYILRPSYLYGPMQNIYREPFVFECALQKRKFYIPRHGEMKLQFFYVEDLCRMIEIILDQHPDVHIFNVGNQESVDIRTFVKLCYEIVGTPLEEVFVYHYDRQRDYFSFHDYEYVLDVSQQNRYLTQTQSLKEGLRESYHWYFQHSQDVVKKPYISFIDKYLK